MKNKKNKRSGEPIVHLPKDALTRVNLGQSFAEYDHILRQPGVFVQTPAVLAAEDPSRSKCFFVGRRGTGKTAITYHLSRNKQTSLQLHPQVFGLLSGKISSEPFRDTRQRPFKSLLCAFKRAIIDETVAAWVQFKLIKPQNLPPALAKERNFIDDYDLDERIIYFVDEFQNTLQKCDDKEWLRLVRRVNKDLMNAINNLTGDSRCDVTLLIDRIDESWDGSDQAVILLMALMHACVQLSAATIAVRPKLFLRENIFERVREIDNEFARFETCVVSMDWSQELLLEMVERRLNFPFNTKLPLRGPTWNYFFESSDTVTSRSMVFEYCQERPRDVLTYCQFAIDSAQSKKHERVTIEDLLSARRRFSDSRLKDLGNEYAENYPQIHLVLSRFFGLGKEFTVPGVTAFIQKLLVDDEVKQNCSRWIYQHTTPERFIHLLYNIGFVGLSDGSFPQIHYRSLGAKSTTPPAITANTRIVVHPSYVDALNLQNIIIGTLDESLHLQASGLVSEFPGAINLNEYKNRLTSLMEQLKILPRGTEHANEFEDIVGDVIRLCFFRFLTNVQSRVRDASGRVIRDWIASNTAAGGFWETMQHRFGATQVIWECKNYDSLKAGDFHQIAYYMNNTIGRLVIVSFRGDEIKRDYYDHIRRISSDKNGAMVLLLMESDLMVFMRQALHGKTKEDHIQNIYDRTIRAIS